MGAPEDERKIKVKHPPPYRRSFEGEDSREIAWSISGYGLALPFSLSLSPSFWLDVGGEALGSRSVVGENVCHEDELNGVAMWSFLVGCNRLIAIITTMKTSPSRLWQEDSISYSLPFIFYHGQTRFLYNVLEILLL